MSDAAELGKEGDTVEDTAAGIAVDAPPGPAAPLPFSSAIAIKGGNERGFNSVAI